jgi:hypothetical protein
VEAAPSRMEVVVWRWHRQGGGSVGTSGGGLEAALSRRTRAPASTTPSSAGLDGAEEDQASIGLTGRRAKEDRRVGSRVGCGVPAVEADLGRADVV